MDQDTEAAVSKLVAAFKALGGGGTVLPQRLSPHQKVGLIILSRAIVHLQRGNIHVSMLGHAMVELLGKSEWPDQPVQKSSIELLYRGSN